jgi:hypothetical protein
MKRRSFLKGGSAWSALACLAGGPLLARPNPVFSGSRRRPSWGPARKFQEQVRPVDELVTPETASALGRGLNFLAAKQVRSGNLQGALGTGGYAAGVAVAALGGLAFLCSGSTPMGGSWASNIRECTRFLLRNTDDRGYISSENSQFSNMYGHGYGMLFLSQVYGMTDDIEIREKLERSVKMTCSIQNAQGGWRYQPQKQDGDLSITICQVMALRAAHDAGLMVPDEVRKRTISYVEKSQNPDGGFRYMLQGGRVSMALTAAGVVSLYSAGIYEGERVEKALRWLMDRMPGKARGQEVSPMNWYYAHYYAVQAMWHAQLHHPEYWNAWYPAIRDELLEKRLSNGTWNDERIGPEFGTAMACIILQIPFNYLPVFAP